ncbi:MAG: hypothetical protein IT431_05495 [Phycisphaerales bacterium]|nr:hypothetical protein [Phycisphaerales bacterium]
MRRTSRQLAALALSLGLATLATAQSTQSAEDTARGHDALRDALRATAIEQLQATLGPTINTTFAGGTLEDYVQAVKQAAGAAGPTIMLRGDSHEITVAPVDLRDIRMFNALQLLDGQHNPAPGSYYRVSTDNVGQDRPAYLVAIESQGRLTGQAPRDFRVLPIREITEALPGDPPEIVLPAETVLTAIETVLGITNDDGIETEIRFHPESGLLMLAGPTISLNAAEQVLDRIFTDVEQRRDRARELQSSQGLNNPDMVEDQLNNARAEAEMAGARVQLAEQELAFAHEELQRMQAMFDAGTVAEGEYRHLQLRVATKEAEMREQKIMLERCLQQAQQAERRLQRSKEIVNSAGAGGSETDALRAENAMLRERLAVMEAQIANLSTQLKGRDPRPGAAGGGAR